MQRRTNEVTDQVTHLLSDIVPTESGAVRSKCSVLSFRVARAVIIVESDYGAPNLSLDLISRRLGLTKPYLCRVFRRELGIGIPEYLRRVRAHQAEKLLRETVLSVKEITATVGFTYVTQLDRAFKGTFGCTPKNYRRNIFGRTLTSEA